MSKRIPVFLLIVLLAVSRAASGSTTSPRPIRQTELLALVAGNALPENIVNEIRTRGIAFRLDSSFRAQLTTAGATPSILAALAAGKPPAKDNTDEKPDPALLQHIATAAKLMKAKHYDEAADELTATLKGNFEKFEIGFVMGELLRLQENWGQAAAVYAEVVRQNPDFPEAHTKLSFVLYRAGDATEALREAKAALARTAQNAEAFKNAGLALQVLGKPDAALAEYKEALRIKPDYGAVHYDLGILFDGKSDFDSAIAEYKKAIALDPDSMDPHNNLSNVLREKGDFPSAVREAREAKRLDSGSYYPRYNLAAALMDLQNYPEAIREFRELEAMFPGSEICHMCFGNALRYNADFEAAEKEFQMAAKLNPSDPDPIVGLGDIFMDQKNYDAALDEFQKAEQLDESSYRAHRGIGIVLLTRKDAPGAIKELKLAVDLNPSLSSSHDLYGQALLLSGDVDAAISEFREAINLDPKQVDVRLKLARPLEKKGDWVAALDQYRQASIADNVDPTSRPLGVPFRTYGAAQEYSQAQERFSQYLASLRKAGKSSEAAQLEKTLRDAQSASKATDKLDALMQAGWQAITAQHFDEAENDYLQALQIAETLQPTDPRLATILGHLGNMAASRKDFTAAGALFERQLKVTEEIAGPQNPKAVTEPLRYLAMTALAQRDFVSAKKFVQRALDANKKFYGENSLGYAEMLPLMASVYIEQGDYEHAEPYLLQATDIEEKLYNYDARYGGMEMRMLMTLCAVYEKWGKPEKLEPYDRRLISLLEKDAGPDTHLLEQILAREGKTLRSLGRPDEADKVEQRLKSLNPTAAANPN